MSLYDRDYMREGRPGTVGSERNPGNLRRVSRAASKQLGHGEQIGFVIAAAAVIGLLLGIALL